jgi:nicotinate-nucleotide adenylyltransferase
MKIGILGGAFDPITKGHIEICNYLINEKIVDEVWLSPCYVSHYGKNMADDNSRLEMCKLAIDNAKIKVSDFEIKNKLSGDSLDILSKYMEANKEHQIYFIIGMDNGIKITTWPDWEKLIALLPIIVVPRVGYTDITNLWFTKEPHIYAKNCPANDISSTQVRKDIKETGKSSYLADEINEYIKNNKTY